MKSYPVTVSFVFLCCIIAIINLFLSGNINYSNESVIKLGGLEKDLIADGQVWRLITYAIGHMSLVHLIFNIPITYILSRSVERYFGSRKFTLFMLIMAIGGGVSFYYFYEGTIAIAGSSGPAFGLIGLLTVLALRYPDNVSPNYRQFIFFVLMIAFLSTFVVPGIAISVHVGGMVTGAAIALLWGKQP